MCHGSDKAELIESFVRHLIRKTPYKKDSTLAVGLTKGLQHLTIQTLSDMLFLLSIRAERTERADEERPYGGVNDDGE